MGEALEGHASGTCRSNRPPGNHPARRHVSHCGGRAWEPPASPSRVPTPRTAVPPVPYRAHCKNRSGTTLHLLLPALPSRTINSPSKKRFRRIQHESFAKNAFGRECSNDSFNFSRFVSNQPSEALKGHAPLWPGVGETAATETQQVERQRAATIERVPPTPTRQDDRAKRLASSNPFHRVRQSPCRAIFPATPLLHLAEMLPRLLFGRPGVFLRSPRWLTVCAAMPCRHAAQTIALPSRQACRRTAMRPNCGCRGVQTRPFLGD